MQLKKERNYLFDNMKVVLIFFVVSAHYIRISGSFDPATFAGFLHNSFFIHNAGIPVCIWILFKEYG